MTLDLWTWEALAAGAAGRPDGQPSRPISGLSIDTRALAPGDVFVALRSERDGHEFVSAAFAKGAAAALVSESYERRPGDGALLRVADTLRGLESLAAAARARSAARIVAVTGSAGKTGTKEALARCLARAGATHAAEKSFNNHWGVPLTLARMPEEARYGVFEIGMNHAGEIGPLSRLARPHVAIVTTVEPVHLAQFRSVLEIALAKAEIFEGLEPGGVAILNRDNAYFDVSRSRALALGARVVSFGEHGDADVRAEAFGADETGTHVAASVAGRRVAYRVGAPGRHLARNSLAVVAALDALGADLDACLPALADMAALPGRGARTVLPAPGGEILLIDESYNANPASMRAALEAMATAPRARYPRRVVALGDMLELGADSPALHAGLAPAVAAAGADLVFACGPHMKNLIEALPAARRGAWAETSDGVREALLAAASAGDVIMVKGSFGSRMAPLVEALRAHFARTEQHKGRA